MDAQTARDYARTPYAKALADAAAARAAQAVSARQVWNDVFNDAALWFDFGGDEWRTRPTEYAALQNICGQARNPRRMWRQWEREQLLAPYRGVLTTLAQNAEKLAQYKAEEEAMLIWRAQRDALLEAERLRRKAAKNIGKTQMELQFAAQAA